MPIVVLSTVFTYENDASEHVSAFLTKPVRRSHLYDALVNAFDPETPPRPSAVEQRAQLAASLGHNLPRTIRILLAEDNVNNQRVAQLSLKRLGLRADTVANGKEALESVRSRTYDVVLMDVHMPEVDGFEATRMIREDTQIKQPHIIAVTANATVQDREWCLEAGMDDYISKPYRLRDLRRVLGRYAEVRNSGEAAPTESPDLDGEEQTDRRALSFDPKVLEHLMELLGSSDRKELGDFIDSCLPGLSEEVDRVGEAMTGSDARALQLAAHSLKPNAATLGASELEQLASELETEAKSTGSLRRARVSVEELHATHGRFLAALREARGRWGD